jgi:hypothetical protein
MQLPPTILSIDKSSSKTEKNNKKTAPVPNTKEPILEPAEVTTVEDVKSSSEGDSDADDSVAEAKATSPKSQSTLKPSTVKKKSRCLRPPRSLEITLFDRLEKMYGAGIKRMLNVQYRFVIRDIGCDSVADPGHMSACIPRLHLSHLKSCITISSFRTSRSRNISCGIYQTSNRYLKMKKKSCCVHLSHFMTQQDANISNVLTGMVMKGVNATKMKPRLLRI